MKIGDLVKSTGPWSEARGNVGIITEKWTGEYGYPNYIVEFLQHNMQKAYYSRGAGAAVSSDGESLQLMLEKEGEK